MGGKEDGGMTVRELIKILADKNPDSDVIIAESQFDSFNVLVILDDPYGTDNPEIVLGDP